jgi:hypothetical protein
MPHFLTQNGLALAQVVGGLTGHAVASQWHESHFDVVMSHAADDPHALQEPACQHECDQHHHLDIKPADPVLPEAKFKSKLMFMALLALTALLLTWLLPVARCLAVFSKAPVPHRNSLPSLIRSTVLRH